MAYKFALTLKGKNQKASVHELTKESFMLTMKSLFYRCFKTDDIDLPYVSDEDVSEMKKNGYYDMIGAKADGERLDMITVKINQ